MKLSFDGREWEFSEDAITIQQAIAIHLAYGFTVAAWLDGMGRSDPRAWQCAYWLMLAQNGETRPLKDCDGPLVAFMSAYAEAQQEAQAVPEPEPDPTSPSGGQPSREHSSRPATTRQHHGRGEAATGS